MVVGMAGQKQEEIETIRPRTIKVKLSESDVKRISEKATAHGLTVGELIQNFIDDLVRGTYSNGSDERMYTVQWFNRCLFGMFPDLTSLRYLIEWGGLDEVIYAWENIESTEESIQTNEEALASGVMKAGVTEPTHGKTLPMERERPALPARKIGSRKKEPIWPIGKKKLKHTNRRLQSIGTSIQNRKRTIKRHV